MLSYIISSICLVQASLALSCDGEADIVIAIPGSKVLIPQNQFALVEDFLVNLVNYYTVSADKTNVGLILYGSEPTVVTHLDPTLNKRDTNTQIALLTQRQLYYNMDGGINTVKAMEAIIEELGASRRPNAAKIGIILTNVSNDLSASTPAEVRNMVIAVGQKARYAGITMFALSSNNTIPGFEYLGKDRCRLFSMGNYSGLSSVLPYLASGTCYVFDDTVSPTPGNCFPGCSSETDGYYPDPNNCCYFLQCASSRRYRTKCAGGTFYDGKKGRCDYQHKARCYE